MNTYIAMIDGTRREIVQAHRIDVAARKLARSLARAYEIRGYTQYSESLAECLIETPTSSRKAWYLVKISRFDPE